KCLAFEHVERAVVERQLEPRAGGNQVLQLDDGRSRYQVGDDGDARRAAATPADQRQRRSTRLTTLARIQRQGLGRSHLLRQYLEVEPALPRCLSERGRHVDGAARA